MSDQLNLKGRVLRFIKVTKRKTGLESVIGILLCLLIFVLNFYGLTPGIKPAVTGAVAARDTDTQFVATLVGDISFEGDFPKVLSSPTAVLLGRNLQPYFQQSDFVTGSFQGAGLSISPSPGPAPAYPRDISASSADLLGKWNFSVVSLATAQSTNYDPLQLGQLMTELSQHKIDTVGAGQNLEAAQQISYREINGLKVATLGISDVAEASAYASPRGAGLLPADPLYYYPAVQKANKIADLVIVHVYWGDSYAAHITPAQTALAEALSDAGADIIIGHHPRVLQPVEIINKTVVFYSLGNLVGGEGYTATKESALVQYVLAQDGSARLEITPLAIVNADPQPVIGKVAWFKRQYMFKRLLRDFHQDGSWWVQEDKLMIQLPYNLKKGALAHAL